MARGKVTDKDRGWRDLYRRVQALDGGAYCKVGVLADSDRGGLHEQGPDGKASPLTVAEIAGIMEFGTDDGHVPARSFVRSTFDEQRDKLVELSRRLIVAVVLDGKMDATRALNLMGLMLATAIKLKITSGEGVPPPNAPSTIAAKLRKGLWNIHGNAQKAGQTVRTLVDTSRMLGAVAWAVVFGDKQGAPTYVGKGG